MVLSYLQELKQLNKFINYHNFLITIQIRHQKVIHCK